MAFLVGAGLSGLIVLIVYLDHRRRLQRERKERVRLEQERQRLEEDLRLLKTKEVEREVLASTLHREHLNRMADERERERLQHQQDIGLLRDQQSILEALNAALERDSLNLKASVKELSSFGKAAVRFEFSESDGDDTLLELIERRLRLANKEVLLAMFTFTSDRLAEALVEAQKRGCAVRVVLDGGQLRKEGSPGPRMRSVRDRLQAARIEVREVSVPPVHFGARPGVFHHKYCVIDRTVVLTGSFNWTEKADRENYEHVVVIEGESAAQECATRFESLAGL